MRTMHLTLREQHRRCEEAGGAMVGVQWELNDHRVFSTLRQALEFVSDHPRLFTDKLAESIEERFEGIL